MAGVLQFPYRRGNAPLDNIDDLSEMGFYSAAGVSWNPSGTSLFGILILITSFRTQIYIDVEGVVAVRVRSNDVWKPWRVITGDLV